MAIKSDPQQWELLKARAEGVRMRCRALKTPVVVHQKRRVREYQPRQSGNVAGSLPLQASPPPSLQTQGVPSPAHQALVGIPDRSALTMVPLQQPVLAASRARTELFSARRDAKRADQGSSRDLVDAYAKGRMVLPQTLARAQGELISVPESGGEARCRFHCGILGSAKAVDACLNDVQKPSVPRKALQRAWADRTKPLLHKDCTPLGTVTQRASPCSAAKVHACNNPALRLFQTALRSWMSARLKKR